jgi:hypothetical protein
VGPAGGIVTPGGRVFSDSSFCLVCYLNFSVLQNARVFLFRGFFFSGFLKPEYGFLSNPPVEETVKSMEKRLESFVKDGDAGDVEVEFLNSIFIGGFWA